MRTCKKFILAAKVYAQGCDLHLGDSVGKILELKQRIKKNLDPCKQHLGHTLAWAICP